MHALTLLYVQVTNEAFFDILRTKEQLGYVVSNSAKRLYDSVGIRFLIQSEKSNDFLDDRIEQFLTGFHVSFSSNFQKELQLMKSEDFASHKAALKNSLLEKKKTLSEECNFYWNQISTQLYEFHYNLKLVEALECITQASLMQFISDSFERQVSVRLGKKGEFPQSQ